MPSLLFRVVPPTGDLPRGLRLPFLQSVTIRCLPRHLFTSGGPGQVFFALLPPEGRPRWPLLSDQVYISRPTHLRRTGIITAPYQMPAGKSACDTTKSAT